jgi:hypothetical protein
MISGMEYNLVNEDYRQVETRCHPTESFRIPWKIGNHNGDYARTEQWTRDRDRLTANGVLYNPPIHPGFGWDNLMNQLPGTTHK